MGFVLVPSSIREGSLLPSVPRGADFFQGAAFGASVAFRAVRGGAVDLLAVADYNLGVLMDPR